MTNANSEEMARKLNMSEREWEIVAEILARELVGKIVWAFGSRATGRNLKRFSDLDLAVAGQLSANQRAAASDAFDESLVSFKVDIVELDLVDQDFRDRIKKDLLLLQGNVDQGNVDGLGEARVELSPGASSVHFS